MTKKEFEQAQREVFAAATPEQRAQIMKDQLARDKAALDKQRAYEDVKANLRNLRDFPEYLTEDKNPNVLFRGGPWLERGGGAFIIGTAGIGKSIFAMQLMLACAASVEFCGIVAAAKLRVTYIQSEDSDNRVAHDFADCLAEMREKHPDVDWDDAASRVDVYNMTGKTGAAFLEALDLYLFNMTLLGKKPDLIVINPLLAFIGGAITDSAYVTPFLRGGRMPDGTETIGLQAILEKHHVGVLIFHHTPKPPTEKEIDAWMKSTFPEYQGAGSADITNWGRSFLMIMRVKGKPGYVCVTAGKNGSRLGWEQIGGAYRHYLAYSGKPGVDGLRNAWRELTDAEYAEVVNAAKTDAEKNVEKVADIGPYVTWVLDHARAEWTQGEFHGLTQDAIIKAVSTAIQMDGRTPFAKIKMRELLDNLPPEICQRAHRKPVYYGTRADIEYWFTHG
jgi:hypothetical protein